MSNEGEELPVEAWIVAAIKELTVAQNEVTSKLQETKDELTALRRLHEKSNIHLKYAIDLSVARENKEIADFIKDGIEIDSVIVLPVPNTVSIKLRSIEDETIDLSTGDDFTLSGHIIKGIMVTNTASSGIVYIHVYGR